MSSIDDAVEFFLNLPPRLIPVKIEVEQRTPGSIKESIERYFPEQPVSRRKVHGYDTYPVLNRDVFMRGRYDLIEDALVTVATVKIPLQILPNTRNTFSPPMLEAKVPLSLEEYSRMEKQLPPVSVTPVTRVTEYYSGNSINGVPVEVAHDYVHSLGKRYSEVSRDISLPEATFTAFTQLLNNIMIRQGAQLSDVFQFLNTLGYPEKSIRHNVHETHVRLLTFLDAIRLPLEVLEPRVYPQIERDLGIKPVLPPSDFMQNPKFPF